jgi:alpha-1,2-mannosyltransferase
VKLRADIQRQATASFSNSIKMPSFEEELVRQIGGWGHVRFGRSYRFAAGYVCILVATLAGIGLAQFSYVELSGNRIVTISAIVPRAITPLVALAYPAVFVNLAHGQNGFIGAALLGGALLLLNQRPIISGVFIGLLAYKPQFGLLIPLALFAAGRWTVIATAAATVFAVCTATLALFGAKVWLAFADSTILIRSMVLEGNFDWEKIQSIFSAIRMWGGGIDIAYATQGGLALAVAAGLIWLWRSGAASDVKAAALAVATLIATPYVFDYDLMMMGVAIAFYVRHSLDRGFRDFEISLLAFIWIVPLLARSLADVAGIPLGLIAQLTLFIMTLERAHYDAAAIEEAPNLARA